MSKNSDSRPFSTSPMAKKRFIINFISVLRNIYEITIHEHAGSFARFLRVYYSLKCLVSPYSELEMSDKNYCKDKIQLNIS